MDKCKVALANIFLTAITSVIEYKTASTEEEGVRRIRNRIKKNKTIESMIECIIQDDCDCKQNPYT
ncbi:hypothetical protein [Nitrosopumilus sp.]|uniref:hypothetical protein n=1 Tax=Nitrosopumilus sp. TaxID=2024843 RepID=UPI0034A01400